MTPLQYMIDNDLSIIIPFFMSQDLSKSFNIIDNKRKSMKALITKDTIEVFEKTTLFISIEKRNTNVIKALLTRTDIDINEKSFHYFGNSQLEEKSALHLAVEIGDLEIIKLILEKKNIDMNIEDSQGKKPIYYSKSDEITKLLSE